MQGRTKMGSYDYGKTANPRMGEHRDRSPLWRATVHNKQDRKDYVDAKGSVRKVSKYDMSEEKVRIHACRVCYSHEYIGDGTKYPYTLGQENALVSDGEQICLFD